MLKRIRGFFIPANEVKKTAKFDNNALLNELKLCFTQGLAQESVGTRMLYPTSFNLLLNPADYNDREQALPFVVQEVVNTFYDIIKANKQVYKNYEPPSKNWYFQFSPCSEINLSGATGDKIIIESGSPRIIAALYTTAIGNSTAASNIKLSFKPKNSDTYGTFDINASVFNGIDVLARGVFKVKFNTNLETLTEAPDSQDVSFAEITYRDGSVHKKFIMVDKEIIISRKSVSSYKETHILEIDAINVLPNHARIKFDVLTGNFTLAAFGDVKVNQRTVALSEGSDIHWVPLTKKADILIGSLTPLGFLATK